MPAEAWLAVGRWVQEFILPEPSLQVSDWADQRRYLSQKASAEHGPWKTSRTPYLRQPMNEFSVNNLRQEIVLVFASQTGKSEAANNCIGYALDVAPGPVLMVQPTEGMAKRYSKMRIAPMIESTPTLASKVAPSRSRDSGNTLLMKEFLNDALLIVGGANAASSLASMPIRYGIEDEIDRFPLDVDGEGSPSDLVGARLRTYGSRRKRLKTSTPTLAGQSAIWADWELSDQHRYHVPCPHCEKKQVLSWDKMRYDSNDPEIKKGLLSAPPVMVCEHCGEGFDETTKSWWYGEDLGEWIPDNPGAAIAGYHLPGFYSPLGWLSWSEIVLGYEKAKDNETKMKVWVNTVLAECWAEQGEAPEWEALYRRREPYQRGVVPRGGLVCTMGVDVQPDRLELEILAWGRNMENWSVDYVVLHGDTSAIQTNTATPCVWRDLEEQCRRVLPCEGGGELPLEKIAVDSGFQTQTVYQWVRKQHDPRIAAIKGRAQLTTPLGLPSLQDVTVRGKKAVKGIRLWPVGVNVIKTEVYGWLRQPPPLNAADPAPRGFSHFPEYDEAYFLGLTAEQVRSRVVKGFIVWDWVKVRERNEPLDVRNYNRAATVMLGMDRWPEERWKQREAALATVQEALAEGEPAPPVVKKARRRRGRYSIGQGR